MWEPPESYRMQLYRLHIHEVSPDFNHTRRQPLFLYPPDLWPNLRVGGKFKGINLWNFIYD